MRRRNIMWVLVIFLVTTTVAVAIDNATNSESKSKPIPSATPPINSDADPRRYEIVDYELDQVLEYSERERRKRVSQRYDNQGWVQKNPHPETSMIGRHTEEAPPAILPTAESEVVVIGTVAKVTTHLSNDKTGVYSEYKVKVDQVLKGSDTTGNEQSTFIKIDRAGGLVRYPHGQTVLYLDSDKGLPVVGNQYLLFLKSPTENENYAVLTLYELQETATKPLDSGRRVDDIKRMGKSTFVRIVKDKLSRQVSDDTSGRKP